MVLVGAIQADGRILISSVSLTYISHPSNRPDIHYSSSGNSVIMVTNHLLIRLRVVPHKQLISATIILPKSLQLMRI